MSEIGLYNPDGFAFQKNAAQPVVDSSLIMWLDARIRASYQYGATTWFDLSGNRNHGTLSNATYGTEDKGRIVFNGTSTLVTYPAIVFTNAPFTLEFFGSINGLLDSLNRRGIFGFNSNASELSNSYAFLLQFIGDGVLQTFNFGIASDPYQFPSFQYFHWVFTIDVSRITTVYVNGLKNPSQNQLSSFTNITMSFNRFGLSLSASNRYYVGNLLTARIYSRALSVSEVQQNFNSLSNRLNKYTQQ